MNFTKQQLFQAKHLELGESDISYLIGFAICDYYDFDCSIKILWARVVPLQKIIISYYLSSLAQCNTETKESLSDPNFKTIFSLNPNTNISVWTWTSISLSYSEEFVDVGFKKHVG